MRNTLIVVVMLVGLTVASDAWAKCYFDGTAYETGTKVGTLVCQPSVRRQQP